MQAGVGPGQASPKSYLRGTLHASGRGGAWLLPCVVSVQGAGRQSPAVVFVVLGGGSPAEVCMAFLILLLGFPINVLKMVSLCSSDTIFLFFYGT